MPDIVDVATEQQEQILKHRIAAARRSAPVLPSKGSCYNCGEPLGKSERFCDADCASDYERLKRK